MNAARSSRKPRRVRRLMTEAEMAAVLADPRTIARWHKRIARYTDPNACWIWSNYEKRQGSFTVVVDGTERQIIASRMALMLKLGRPLGAGMFACHECDRPGCVNPACLWEGTNTDNMQDASRKGRLSRPWTPAERARHIERKREAILFYTYKLEGAKRKLAEMIAENEVLAHEEATAVRRERPMMLGRLPYAYSDSLPAWIVNLTPAAMESTL